MPEQAAAIDPHPGLREHAEAVASGATTSSRLVAAAIARIEGSQASLNAFRCVRAEATMTEAAEADERLAAGEAGALLAAQLEAAERWHERRPPAAAD